MDAFVSNVAGAVLGTEKMTRGELPEVREMSKAVKIFFEYGTPEERAEILNRAWAELSESEDPEKLRELGVVSRDDAAASFFASFVPAMRVLAAKDC